MIISIDEVIPTKSLKNNDFRQKLLLKKSIKKYDQIYPIIINSKNEIIKGNTLYSILKELNYEKVYVKIINCDNDYQLYLELNMIKGELNPIECFEKFKGIDKNNNCLPYTKQQINDFIKLLDFDWNQYKVEDSFINDLF